MNKIIPVPIALAEVTSTEDVINNTVIFAEVTATETCIILLTVDIKENNAF